MESQTVKLYGYEQERAQIEAAIAEQRVLQFVCLHGPGGIGKTTMLRAIYEAYRDNHAYRIVNLLDFDDLRLHIVQNILHAIASQLHSPGEIFSDYFEQAARLRDMQRQDVSRLHIGDQEDRTRRAFIQDYHTLAARQQSILLFDTVEKVQDLALWDELLNLLLQFKNVVILLAGRRNVEVKEEIEKQLKTPDAAQVVPLSGLSEQESLEYFKRTELGQFLAKENSEQTHAVCWFSAGRPILVDLAVDWLGQGMELTIPDGLLDRQDETQQQFEQGLVEQVNDLGEPKNEVILDMAHVYHYFDAERYSYLHDDVSLKDVQAVLDELRDFSFVKPQPGGGIRLHDEMQRMVSRYVWSVRDWNRKRRRQLSERMVQYYEEHLPEYKKDPVAWQASVAEQLYHRLYTDLREGHRNFRRIFRQALSRHQVGFAHVLLNTLEQFSADFDEELTEWSEIHKGRLLRAEEKVQEAIDLIHPAKERLQKLNVREGMDTVCNALGYCYRLLGDWKQAIVAYEEALKYSLEEQDARQIAETMNNIANICRLGGDFEQANRYSLLGLKIREKLGDDKVAIGNSCYVRGMISWEIGNTAEAAEYGQRARKLFDEIDDLRGIAEVDRLEGYLHFRTGDLDGAMSLLKQAQVIFDQEGIGLGLADTLNVEARILIDKYAAEGETEHGFRDVERVAGDALSVAERIRDHYKMAECHLTLCRLYFRWGRYLQNRGDETDAQKYYRLSRGQYDDPNGGQLARKRNYLALWSIYEWAMGDLAFELGDWETAFNHYLQECATASRFKEARFARALNALSNRLHRLPRDSDGSQDLTRQYCDYVINEWKALNLDKHFPELVEECEYIKSFLRLIDPEYLRQLQQWGADLLMRGEWRRATKVYQELLDATQIYTPDERAAWAMNQSAWAYRQMGDFVQARRLCQQSLLIRQGIGELVPIASSRLAMGTIMWTTGNTTEAAYYLRLSRKLYRQAQNKVGLAHANRHSAFMHFRIGDHEQAQDYLDQARDVFRSNSLHIDLAEALNLSARVLQRSGDYQQALDLAQEARHLAYENGAYYIIAEALLTLGSIEYDMGSKAMEKGDKEKAQQHFEQAKSLHRDGYEIAKRYGYELLLSVCESMAARIAFDEKRYADAFEHYVRDLEFGARYERGRMRRELDQIVDRLVRLPTKLRRFYADYIINEWTETGLAEAEPDIPRLFRLFKEYNDYV